MSEQSPAGNVATRSYANKALVASAILGCSSVFVPAVVWRLGRWDVIFAVSGAFCLASLVTLWCGTLTIRRGARGFRPLAAIAISSVALVFWGFLIFAFIRLSHGGE
jgi:hypothetical protein